MRWRGMLAAAAVLLALAGPARAQTPSGIAEVMAAFAGPRAEGELRVLFIGNSFTRDHDVPARVAALAAGEGVRLRPGMVVGNGLWLKDHAAAPGIEALIGGLGWDVLVLQDHSTAALAPGDAAGSRAAALGIGAMGGTRVVLFATWPRAPGHALYGKPGMPAGPGAMNALVRAHYAALGEAMGARVAGVGDAFLAVAARGAGLYAPDSYHASAEGARLAASILVAAILAPPRLPLAPERAGREAPEDAAGEGLAAARATESAPRLEFSRAPG